jgi:hypothetical protein
MLDSACLDIPNLHVKRPSVKSTSLDYVLGSTVTQGYALLTLISLSSAPVARYLPSGLKQTLRMYKSPSLSTVSSWR